jgi:hypothetical protein
MSRRLWGRKEVDIDSEVVNTNAQTINFSATTGINFTSPTATETYTGNFTLNAADITLNGTGDIDLIGAADINLTPTADLNVNCVSSIYNCTTDFHISSDTATYGSTNAALLSGFPLTLQSNGAIDFQPGSLDELTLSGDPFIGQGYITTNSLNTTGPLVDNTPIDITWAAPAANTITHLDGATSGFVLDRVGFYNFQIQLADPTTQTAWRIIYYTNGIAVNQSSLHTCNPSVVGAALSVPFSFSLRNNVAGATTVKFELTGAEDAAVGGPSCPTVNIGVACIQGPALP